MSISWRSGATMTEVGVAERAPACSPSTLYRRDVVRSIAGGRVPLKFAYAGSAARTHDAYARTGHYRDLSSADHESTVFLTAPCCDLEVTGVAEIGPGNGEHSVELLENLRCHGLRARHYLGVDFSAELLQISRDRLRRHFGGSLTISTAVWDAESRPGAVVENWRAGHGRVLTCLVGHTLGNFEHPAQVIRNLARLLRPGDLLLASVLLRTTSRADDQSLAAYRTAAFRTAALEPMIAVGIDPAEMDFTIDYRDGAFVGEVTLPRGARIDGMTFPCGYRFRCFVSRRFERRQVLRLFTQGGWTIYADEIKPDSEHMTVVASRTEGLMRS